jgi:peptide/nickel transport system substrate-binding protein
MGWTRTQDVALQGIIDRMNESMNERAYRSAAADLQRYYSNHLCALPLYWNSLVLPYNNRLSGWKVDAINSLLGPESWFSLTETVPADKASGLHSGN